LARHPDFRLIFFVLFLSLADSGALWAAESAIFFEAVNF